jgi:hypothetical protein
VVNLSEEQSRLQKIMPHLPEKILYAYARRFPLRRGKMRVVNALWRHVVDPDDTVRTALLKVGRCLNQEHRIA